MNHKDQRQHWNDIHSKGGMEAYAHEPTDFAKEVIRYFPQNSSLLELGCGLGNDSIFFALRGNPTTGTDFSEAAIEQNAKRYAAQQNLTFQVVDMSSPLPFGDNHFDIVYSRLSLHYFSDDVTKKIFQDIARVIRKDGILTFICKSTDDPLYGLGEQIERDMFIKDGHVRHFFSEAYVRECLSNIFKIKMVKSGKESFYGHESGYVKVIAQK